MSGKTGKHPLENIELSADGRVLRADVFLARTTRQKRQDPKSFLSMQNAETNVICQFGDFRTALSLYELQPVVLEEEAYPAFKLVAPLRFNDLDHDGRHEPQIRWLFGTIPKQQRISIV